MPVELRPKQREVLEPLRSRFVHADPPGTGKTPIGWSWLAEHDAQRSLLVVPRNVLRHWERLAPLWAPEVATAVIPIKTAAKKRAQIREQLLEQPGPTALILPYSVLREDIDYLVPAGFDALLVDEAHKAKGRDTHIHKAIKKLSWRAAAIDLTTASPLLNTADEAWSYMHFIDRKRWPSFWRWAAEHFWITQTDFGGKSRFMVRLVGDPRPGAFEAICEAFGDHLVMRDEAYVLPELPDVVVTNLEVDLAPAERRAYDSMKKHFWLQVDGQVVFASNEVSKITRLRQMSSDWSAMLAEAGVDVGTKVRATVELIEDEMVGRSVVVFADFKSTVKSIVEQLGKCKPPISAVAYSGDQDEDERDAALDAFVAGEVQVLVGTTQTLAEGTDGMQARCNHMVIVDRDWVPEMERQKIGRIKRDGQPEPVVFVWYIVARNTIDRAVMVAGESKQEMIDAIVGRNARQVVDGTL